MATSGLDALNARSRRLHGALTAVHAAVGRTHKKDRSHAHRIAAVAGKKLVAVPMPNRDHALIAKTERAIERIALPELMAIKGRIARLLDRQTQKVAGVRFSKAIDDDTVAETELRDFLASINDKTLEWSADARKGLRELLTAVAEERASTSIDSLTDYLGGNADLAEIVTQANDLSVAWARDRISNLITQVSDTTRDAVNEMTATAIESGWTNRELADELDSAWEFGPERALLIARTEPTFAESAGTLAGYHASGVVEGKGWSGEDPCDLCQGNEDDGIIPLDDDFSSGDDAPPGHPRCECTVYAGVLVDDEAED